MAKKQNLVSMSDEADTELERYYIKLRTEGNKKSKREIVSAAVLEYINRQKKG